MKSWTEPYEFGPPRTCPFTKKALFRTLQEEYNSPQI